MPVRKLPRSDRDRDTVLSRVKSMNDHLPVGVTVLNPTTTSRLNDLQPVFSEKMTLRGAALSKQAAAVVEMEERRKEMRIYISHFIQNFNMGTVRGVFPKHARAFYGLNVNSESVPYIGNTPLIDMWSSQIIEGDAARVANGGAPMGFPTIVEFTAAYDRFHSTVQQLKPLKLAYDLAQEAVEKLRPAADKLILRIYNEVETYYGEENATSMRRKSREWGVMYLTDEGEELKDG